MPKPINEDMKAILEEADVMNNIEAAVAAEVTNSTLGKPQHASPAYGTASLLEAAKALEDRQQIYGPPMANFERIAARWRVHLANRFGINTSDIPLTAQDVSVMMVDVKLARLEETPDHADSWIDVAGYAGCGAHIAAIGRGDVEAE